jgi:peroxisomal 2,4-dienoyl-CoA reductase
MDRLTPDKSNPNGMIGTIPLQRYGTKVDIANSCLFSASPAASYITGVTISVDGGSVLTYSNFTFLSKEFV